MAKQFLLPFFMLASAAGLSAQAPSQLLESMQQYDAASQLITKTLYTHTPSGKISTEELYQGSLLTSKKENAYDSKDSLIQFSYYTKASADQALTGSNRRTFTFDAAGNKTLELYLIWDETTKTWVNKKKTEMAYDAAKNLTEKTISSWDAATGKWKDPSSKHKFQYTFDANKRKTEMIDFDWLGGAWSEFSKETYTYTAAGKIQTVIGAMWMSSKTWKNNYKKEYTYDEAKMGVLRKD